MQAKQRGPVVGPYYKRLNPFEKLMDLGSSPVWVYLDCDPHGPGLTCVSEAPLSFATSLNDGRRHTMKKTFGALVMTASLAVAAPAAADFDRVRW